MEERFNVVFCGEVAAGRTVDEVKQSLANLYKVPVTKIDSWFSGRTVTIKADVDRAAAEKYKNVFEQAGAVCVIEAEGAVEEGSPTTASPPPPPPSEQQTDVEEDSAVAGQQDTKIKKQQQKKRSKDMARKGFFGTLFDLSFTEFITPRVVKFFYVLKIIALVLAWIGGLVFMFFMAPPEVVPGNIKIVILVVSPLVFLLSLIGVRMWFELAIVFFRVEENTRQ